MASRHQNKEKLIREVQCRPALWKEDHSNYRKRDVTEKLWMEVATACGFESENDTKTKWKSLKDQFRREIKKIPNWRSGSQPPHNSSKWQYFEMMWFIKDFILNPRSLGNSGGKKAAEESDQEEEEAVKEEMDSPFEIFHSSEASFSSPKCKRKYRSLDLEDGMLEREKVKLLQGQKEEDNSDLTFFKSLLPYMQEFTLLEKLRVRSDIQNVILNHYSRKNEQANNSAEYKQEETFLQQEIS